MFLFMFLNCLHLATWGRMANYKPASLEGPRKAGEVGEGPRLNPICIINRAASGTRVSTSPIHVCRLCSSRSVAERGSWSWWEKHRYYS